MNKLFPRPKNNNRLVKTKIANRANVLILISMLALDSVIREMNDFYIFKTSKFLMSAQDKICMEAIMSCLYFSQPSYSLFIAHDAIE